MPSNVENILNGILTGDGSGIQKPASRVEELLFEIYEQGGGGGGDSVIGGIKLTIDSDFVMTATLVDKDGEEYGVSDDIDLPLEEMVVDAEYDPLTQKIKLELKNGNYVEFSVAELVSGLQTELSSSNKLNPAYIAYDASHRAVSDTEKDTWNGKQNAISDLEAIRSGAAAGATAVQPATMETALNAKQDTISDLAAIRSGASAGATAVQPATMSEALAAKQNSLSETQLAAVNSGINSTKVGQIETNQENILYAINTGVKNWLPVDSCNVTDGTYIVPRTTEVSLPAGKYIFYINVTSATATGIQFISSIGVDDGNHRTGICTISNLSAGIHYSEVTVLSGTTNITVYVNNAAVIPEIMLCPKELWDTLGHDFKRGAFPNYKLTQLESEDRAALIEQVNNSAKQLLDFVNWSSKVMVTRGTKSVSGNSLTLTATLSDCCTKWEATDIIPEEGKIPVTAGKTYVLSWNTNGGTDDDRVFIFGNGDASKSVFTGASNKVLYYTPPTGVTFITFRVGVQDSGRSVTYSDIMICTLSDWNISNKYVEYCKPLASKTDHTYSLGSVDLNDVIKDGTYMCSPTANSPVSGVSFLQVYNDTSYDLKQVIQKLNEPSILYIRHRRYSSAAPYYTWTSWYKFTGQEVT